MRKKTLTKIESYCLNFDPNTILSEYNKVSRKHELIYNLANESNERIASFFAEMISKKDQSFASLNKLVEADISVFYEKID